VAGCLVGASAARLVAQDEQKRVLVLFAARRDAPGPVSMEAPIQRTLDAGFAGRLDYYSEYLDIGRFPEPDYKSALQKFLAEKYGGTKFDVVIATSDACLAFAEQSRALLFADAPIVYAGSRGLPRPPNSTGITVGLELGRTLDVVNALHPDTRNVYVVGGASAFDKYYEEVARAQFKAYEGRFKFTYLSGLELSALLKQAAALPSDSVIYYIIITEDGAANRMLPLVALDHLTAAASVPVYSWNTVGMDHGIVGGNLLSNEHAARHTAKLAVKVLRGEPPDTLPVVEVDANVVQLDWRQMERWGLSEARAPAGSTVLFRELTAWQRYKVFIIAAVSLVVLQSALIAGLIVERSRRRRAERLKSRSDAELRVSYSRIRDLAGRLITGQEAERARIARDLHDDVCQEVAGVSVHISKLRQRSGQLQDPQTQQLLGELLNRASGLAESVRMLSHDLHPSVLQHVGLVAALEAHTIEVERQHDIQVGFAADEGLGPIPSDAGLCLFRIAQEALRNATRHGNARHASVSLVRTANDVELAVTDDGHGFDLATVHQNGRGLGLVSMDERARLIGGRLSLDSRVGGGTMVRVCIPAAAPADTVDEVELSREPSQSVAR
jgi:signal transduction histidine kinase